MKKLIIVGFLFLTTPIIYANDGERISDLEKQVNEVRLRLARIESLLVNQGGSQLPLTTNKDGWRLLSSWRTLKTGMPPNDVKSILGEPHRVKGGDVAFWYYSNGSSVTFISDKLHSWTEPR